MRISAIILAGGRATRLGGASKGDVSVGDKTMLEAVTDACQAVGVRPEDITVVGQARTDHRIIVEDPPKSGPAAAIGAGMRFVETEAVFLLSCDLPFIAGALPHLVANYGDDGVCFGGERTQYLAGLYRTGAVAASIGKLGTLVNLPVRTITTDLNLRILPPHEDAADVDSWEDVTRARAQAASRGMSAPALCQGVSPAPNGSDPDTSPET